MPIRIVKDAPKTAKKGKAGKAKAQRTGKQFGGGFNRPTSVPAGPLGVRRFGMKHGSKKK